LFGGERGKQCPPGGRVGPLGTPAAPESLAFRRPSRPFCNYYADY
jgi:hypothetical protein